MHRGRHRKVDASACLRPVAHEHSYIQRALISMYVSRVAHIYGQAQAIYTQVCMHISLIAYLDNPSQPLA